MGISSLSEKIYQKYAVSQDEFIREATVLALQKRKREYLIERLDILRRYGVRSVQELEEGIRLGKILEHPGWEDLIEVRNLEQEVKEIENDLNSLQKA